MSLLTGTPLDPRSPQARAIADLFDETLVVCGVIFVVVAGLVTYAVYKFRHTKTPAQIEGNRRLEIAWTIAPALVLVGIFGLTLRAAAGADPPIDRDADITVIAHQWWWEVRYKSGAVTANEIHMPTGKPLVVAVESADVIHDFWVPDLGRKIDAVPGVHRAIWMQADQPGDYVGACAEYCGGPHAWMRILVVAQAPAEFASWEAHTRERTVGYPWQSVDAARGADLFDRMTCVRCHALGKAALEPTAGPDLTHLADRRTLGAGVMQNTPEELGRWLADPQAIKEGSHMPNVHLSPEQIHDFVAYFETLK